jgi:hypothetical protein
MERQFGSPRRRWEESTEVDLQEVKWESWTSFSWLRIERESSCEQDDELRGSRGISWIEEEPLASSNKTLIHGESSQ